MLLTGLRVENFLAYRAATELSLAGVELACLSGSNGAGKSSLLDAVTWALWGEARAKTDDELLHTGQNEMSVTVEFEQDNVRYVVTRKHARRKSANGLSLFRMNDDSEYEPISSGSGNTQPLIDQLLKLSHKTFIHSAFLRQGEADSFTIARPAERKRILAEILDLDRWEHYEKSAKARAKEREGELTQLALEIDRRERELREEPRLQAEWRGVQEIYERARLAREAAEAAYEQVRGANDRMEQAKARIGETARRMQQSQRMFESIQKQLATRQERYADYQSKLAMRDQIEQGYSDWQSARQEDDRLLEVQLAHTQAANQLENERVRLDTEIKAVRKQIAQRQKQLAVFPGTAQLDIIQAQIAALETAGADLETVRGQLIELGNEDAALKARNEALRQEMEAIKGRRDVLHTAGDDAACPVCGQPLDEAHKVDLVAHFETQGTTLGDQYRNNQKRLKQIEQDAKQRRRDHQALEAQIADLPALYRQYERITTEQEQVQRLTDDQARDTAVLQALETQLANEDYGHEIRVAIAEIGYDADYHARIRAAINELSIYDDARRDLERALAEVDDLKTELIELNQQCAEVGQQIKADRQAEADGRVEIAALTDLVAAETRARAGLEKARQAEWNARDEQLRVEQQISVLGTTRRLLVEDCERRDSLTAEQVCYDELAKAFGKNGVPLLIIEWALPELEIAANRLLSHLTDNRLHVQFQTQKDKKTGGLTDTLDLLINDGEETRAYEMYSGGEGFRINFAVRVALSQLLAQRAGARLQTLFIDEGFGSQDGAGREKLIEAINVIHRQFDLILVVTHIDELRDAFPAQIRVTKGDNGASVELVR
ncbi:MAG: AAA family ATPase [Aggregatilineales bacterium]